MKNVIPYYGGKFNLLNFIIPLIPSRDRPYIEPFLGGGSVFWNKPFGYYEVINDKNKIIINLYDVIKNNLDEFIDYLDSYPIYSRDLYYRANSIIDTNSENKIELAWAVFYKLCSSVSCILNGSFAYNKISFDRPFSFRNKLNYFVFYKEKIRERFTKVCIENKDAIDIIKRYDSDVAFFFIDPPYVGAVQGHYKGYSQEMFDELLETLAGIKGTFLMTSHENDSFKNYLDRWYQVKISQYRSARVMEPGTSQHHKTEVLTSNVNNFHLIKNRRSKYKVQG